MVYPRKPYVPPTAPSTTNPDGSKKRGRAGWKPWKKQPTVIPGSMYKAILHPSQEQEAIFEHVISNPRSLVVRALAGTGKTQTIVESMYRTLKVKPGASMLYMIFAKRNQLEAVGKCPAVGVEISTVHAFGLRILRAAGHAKGPDAIDAKGEKGGHIAAAIYGPDDEKIELRYYFAKAVDLAKGYLCENVAQVEEMCDRHEIDLCGETAGSFYSNVLKALDIHAKQTDRIDFSDMVFLPIRLNLHVPKFDYVYGDEIQDLSPARIELLLRAIKPVTGKGVMIGDGNQAVFGFTGAHATAIDTLIERTSADVLTLTKTYRCGKAIVKLAQTLVPEYQADENNPEGKVNECGTISDMMRPVCEGGAGPGDFILSRVNFPLVHLCLNFLKQGRKASIMGRSMGQSLSYMIKRSGAEDCTSFLSWLDSWANLEYERMSKKNQNTDAITDRVECLRAFCEGTNDLAEVKRNIAAMFDDEENTDSRVTLSSVHRSKGLERSRVFVLAKTLKAQAGGEEKNIAYVAFTRAVSELVLVQGDPKVARPA